jgi:pimeloyl-ACP methyl ester carboxylesterase
MTTFVLVHGGGHGGWCWKWTAGALRDEGHDVHSPTLTGFGERAHLASSATSFQTFVDDVVNVVRFEDLHDIVLVGHSMGGTVIPRVAEEIPDRVRRVVWLTAAVCADGESLLETIPPSRWMAEAVRTKSDGTVLTDPELILDAVVHDGTPEQRKFVRDRHTPYPPYALVEPGRLSAFLALDLPTAYVVATEDRAIERPVQEQMADRLPGSRRSEVSAGHDCMVVRPSEVARALSEVSA